MGLLFSVGLSVSVGFASVGLSVSVGFASVGLSVSVGFASVGLSVSVGFASVGFVSIVTGSDLLAPLPPLRLEPSDLSYSE